MKKKLFLLAFLVFLFAYSISSQNFIEVTMSNTGQTIHLNSNQILEIKLPATPSTGYNWYITKIDKGVITTIGDEEFLSDFINDRVGQLGTKIIRIAGISQGLSELTLEYKRLWEKDKASVEIYKIIIVSSGKYSGDYVPPVKLKPVKKINTSTTPKSLPSSFSWQSECTPIKNQGYCGSCWAFAGCGTFEASINIWDHVVKDLSEQWLINCATDMYGCAGGYCPHGYWSTPGAVYESDVPYVSHNDTCMPPYPYHETIMSYGFPFSEAEIKQAIYDYGPVWSRIFASTANFMNYTGGIVTTHEGNGTDHAIVLVGWKDTLLNNGYTGYWILRNSWGTGWGENGYMRIAYGCNYVGESTSYINYRGVIPHALTASFSANTVCGNAPLNVQFTENSYTTAGTTINSWLWDFGDGSNSTDQNPAHSFVNPGAYTVSLTVTNTASATNTLTKSSYILVVTPGTTYNMSNTTVSTCSGGFFDSGGFSGVYQNNENKTMTFLPDVAGNKIQMVFSEFNIYADPYNYLKVYNGTSISSPLIDTYSAINVPGTITASNVDGALTFVFYSNEWGGGRSGWSASISCISSTPVLTVTTTAATAITDTTATIGGNVTTDGGYLVTARGVCGGLTANPTILDFHTSEGTGTGIFTSNVTGLTPNTTYHIRAYAINSIDTAYGSDLTFTTQPTNSPVADFTGSPTTIIEGESVVFTNQSTGTITSYSWSFPGGTPSTATGVGPHTIAYNTAGVYDAILTVGTPANSMTKTNYITINAPDTGYIMSNSTVTTCSGIFYDSGGFGNLYQNYEDLTMTFLPDIAGNKLQMVFSTFDVEAEPNCGYDYLQIFDGNSISAPLIGKYCGAISPGTVTATNAEGALTYVFHSDEAAIGQGWSASISCISSNPVLTVTTTAATAITDTTATIGGNVTTDGGYLVTARGVCGGLTANPTILDFHTSEGTGTGIFTSNVTGLTPNTTYHIRAYAINSIDTAYGSDLTFTTQPTNSPVADFTGSPTTIIEGESVVFTNQSTGTITSYSWSFPGGTPSTATGVGPHTIAYNTAGVYDAILTVGTPANSMTKTNYITINAPDTGYIMSNSTVTTCSGIFYDSGGFGNLYQNYEDLTMTFLPDIAGNKLQMVFSTFDVEAEPNCGYDYLQIFDGNSISAPLIGKYCGAISPGTVTATNAEGALTYVFHSDELVTGSGWDATINCISPNPVPNDDCPNAVTLIQTATCNPTNGTTVDATQSISPITCAGYTANSANDVWYKFVATSATPDITVTGSSSFDAVVDLRSGICNGTNINCANAVGTGGIETINASGLSIGSTYYIRVYSYATAGTFTICVNDGTVGITQNSTNSEVLISPNPTTGIINITNAENNVICIYNIIGELIYKHSATKMLTQVDMSQFSKGYYLVQVISKDQSVMKRINLIK